jgi:inosine-uridine nucleoside N-ribohydrolase
MPTAWPKDESNYICIVLPDASKVGYPIVIDTDPGIDDAVALALAALSPAAHLAAVTTSYGSTTLSASTRNARHLLRLCGRTDVAVLPGCDRPIRRDAATAPEKHGATGVGLSPVPEPHPEDRTSNQHALLEVLAGTDQLVELLTIGPLTNLAWALEADESLVVKRVRRHIGMFGTIHERGSEARLADFNAWCDPEAVEKVLHAGLNTTMVGLDVTRQIVLRAAEAEILAASEDPLQNWLGKALQFYVKATASESRVNGCYLHDVLIVGEALCPGLLTCERVFLTVDLDEGEGRGHTKVDASGVPTMVATAVDVALMQELLGVVFGKRWSGWVNTGGHG